MRKAGIHLKVRAVLQVLDDFTGRPVSLSLVRLQLSQGLQAIRKEGGLFVIVGGGERELAYTLTSPVYEEASGVLRLEDYEEACPCIKVRLLPSAAMSVPEGVTLLEGRTAPESRVYAVCLHSSAALKLLKDCPQGDCAEIYHAAGENLSGRTLAFCQKEGEMELARVRLEEGGGLCRLETVLKHGYKRVGTSIYPVREAKADQKGYYRILLDSVPLAGCPCRVMIKGADGSESVETLDVKYKSRNRRDE